MTDFAKGMIAGAVAAVILFGVIHVVMFFNRRDKEVLEYAETQNKIQSLREDYGNRDPYEFLDDIPGARGAADSGIERIHRKRDEIIQRQRNTGDD
jgi:hypothetical protein